MHIQISSSLSLLIHWLLLLNRFWLETWTKCWLEVLNSEQISNFSTYIRGKFDFLLWRDCTKPIIFRETDKLTTLMRLVLSMRAKRRAQLAHARAQVPSPPSIWLPMVSHLWFLKFCLDQKVCMAVGSVTAELMQNFDDHQYLFGLALEWKVHWPQSWMSFIWLFTVVSMLRW